MRTQSPASDLGNAPPEFPDFGSPVVLSMRDVAVSIGHRRIVRDVNLDIYENQILGVMGRSGVGKSTLALVMADLADDLPDLHVEGTITFRDDLESERDRRRVVGYLPQRPVMFPMSIRENVAQAALHNGNVGGEIDEIVESSLQATGLWDEVKDRLDEDEVSPGQLQRLALARLLAADPPIMILDEPTAHLDPASVAQFEEALAQIKDHKTIVMISHSLHGTARVTDRAALFASELDPKLDYHVGLLVEVDSTATLFSNPADERTENFITGRVQ